MKVLYVVGSCLTKNTSANMSHNGYVQGLLENGAEVDIVMADDSWGKTDPAFSEWKQARYFIYRAESLKDALRKKARNRFGQADTSSSAVPLNGNEAKRKRKISIRSTIKKMFYYLFPTDPLYPLEEKWLKTASSFKSNKEYDLVISNSSPAASHKLVSVLKSKKAIQYRKWIQIWEDPWYYDLYGGHTKVQKEEEHKLLKEADRIYYVSPLTLMYQKQHFSDCSDKMCFVPLPAFDFASEDSTEYIKDSFGYFGDYYSQTRNLEPFYRAAKKTEATTFIIGDSDLNLLSDEQIQVKPRITLQELEEYQKKTQTLVHLCNLKGGQIPGKIYHYSITKHPILFILDGTEDEKKQIRSFFSKYQRYMFCENDEESIAETVQEIINRNAAAGEPVTDFYPKNIVARLIEENI